MTNTLDLESKINVSGHMRIENGDTVIEADNKMTGMMMAHWISMIAGHNWSTYTPQNYRWNGIPNNFVVLGTDTTHPTTYNMTALYSPIGTAPGTKPQTYNASTSVSADGTEYYFTWLFTFPANSISGTVGEVGIYFITSGGLVAGNGSCGATTTMNGRVCVADGEMNSFLIDSQKPITVTWTYKFVTDGKFLRPFLYNLINSSTSSWDAGDYTLLSRSWGSKTTWMVIGQNTTIGNNILTTTGLTTPINTGGTGTVPNTQTLATSNPSNGVYKCTWSASWNAGIIAAGSTLGEIGLYLYGRAQLDAMYFAGQGQGAYFSARMNVKDGHFNSVAIDSTKPLTIVWTVTMTFT
jgi:hypothetical protein